MCPIPWCTAFLGTDDTQGRLILDFVTHISMRKNNGGKGLETDRWNGFCFVFRVGGIKDAHFKMDSLDHLET